MFCDQPSLDSLRSPVAHHDGDRESVDFAGVTGETEFTMESHRTTSSPSTATRPGPQWLAPVVILASYLVAARLLFVHLSLVARHQIPFSPTGDQVQQVWFLAWGAHAVRSLSNPLFTTALNSPHGVNLMTNTAMPLLSVLGAPLTWLLSPLGSYALLLQLGFALSAFSAAIATHRLGSNWWASWFVGVVFGFGAPHVVDGSVHVFVAFNVLLPWILVAVILLARGDWSPRRFGVVVGLLLALEVLISTERAAIEALVLLVAYLVCVIARKIPTRPAALTRGFVVASIIVLALTAIPLWYFFSGPQSISGAPHTNIPWSNASFSSLVRPGPYLWWSPWGTSTSNLRFLQGDFVNAAYLGLPLMLLAALGVWRFRARPLVRAAATTAVIFGVLSLGPTLQLGSFSIPSPARIVSSLPLIHDILPFRYLNVVLLLLAWLGAQCFEGAYRHRQGRSRKNAMGVLAFILLVGTLITLIPRESIPASSDASTSWLTTPTARGALPSGERTLTYPYATTLFNTPMLDQASSNLWYDLIGGQAIAPNADGSNVGIQPLAPTVVFDVLYRCSQPRLNAPVSGLKFTVGPMVPNDATTQRAFRLFVARNHVGTVFWRWWGYHPALALQYLEAAYGPGVSYDHGQVRIWHFRSY